MNRAESPPMLDRVMAWSLARALPPLTRYLLATLIVCATAYLRALFVTTLVPYLLFIPVVLLIALTMGRRTGYYAVALSATFASVAIAAPTEQYWLSGRQWAGTGVYILTGSVVVVIASELRAAFRRAGVAATALERSNALLTEREEQLQLLNHELGHRLKNQLSIVQAVAGQTLRQAGDLKSANEALSSRLAALGRATDVLIRSEWTAADLDTLARTALMAHQSVAGRFDIAGPAIRFDPQVALALTLAFHELMTNAIKYGALSNDGGRVVLGWSVQPGPIAAERRFTLVWQEIGGPEVRLPTRRGFGSLMIERSLRSYFKGETSTVYDPAGLVFRIDAPLGEAREGAA